MEVRGQAVGPQALNAFSTTAAIMFGVALAAQAQTQPLADARRAVRAADCARCHGKDYEGLAAPSIVEFARTQGRERFIAAVLDGNPPMGMPAYRGNPPVEGRIDEIYRYFAGGADGK
jgi:cytochrome c55X